MLLAIDVGKGTEDVMIYDPDTRAIENTVQLVFPSQAQLLSNKLSNDTSEKIVIDGELMAGEPWYKEVYTKTEQNPESVVMSTTAARSIRYNIEQVREKQVKIVNDNEIDQYKSEASVYSISDVGWKRIFGVLKTSEIDYSDISNILLCCQDHGEPNDLNRSTRDFRMKKIYNNLDNTGNLGDLLQRKDKIPNYLPRHKAIAESAKKQFPHLSDQNIYVMDSSPAVIMGAFSENKDEEIVINVGNGHTLAIYFVNSKVKAVYETHTGGVTPSKINNEIKLLLTGELTHEYALERGGHGVYIRDNLDLNSDKIEKLKPYTLIGPNRRLLYDLAIRKVHPAGNMMMAGPVGLIRAWKKTENSVV